MIHAERTGDVATLAIDSGRANALDLETLDALIGAVAAVETALVITGWELRSRPFPIAVLEICGYAFGPAVTRAALRAELHTPHEALRLGLIDHAVEQPELLPRARSLSAHLASFSPAAYALTKRELHRPVLEAITAAAPADDDVRLGWTSAEGIARITAQLDAMSVRRDSPPTPGS